MELGEDTPPIHPLSVQRVTARELIAIRKELARIAALLHILTRVIVGSLVLLALLLLVRWMFFRG
jgi:hypothetical protein